MRYTVVGNHTVDGVDPGGTLALEDEARARYLTRAGHIAPKVTAKKQKEEVTDDGDSGLE